MTKIGQDIGTIDRNMREILKHITNLQKLTPLEPLQETPYTPTTAPGSFQFSFDPVQYANTCDSSPVNSDSGFMHEQKEPAIKTGIVPDRARPCFSSENTSLGTPDSNHISCIPDLLSRTSEEARECDKKALRNNKSDDNLLGDSSSVDKHDTVVRRHSDGPETRNRQEQNIIVTKDILPGTTKDKTIVSFIDDEMKIPNMRNMNVKDVCIPVQSDTDSSQCNDVECITNSHYDKNYFKSFHMSPLHDLVTEETRLLNNFTEIHLNGCNAIDSDYRTSTSESYDVSPETPDAATDISESIKTEEEEVLIAYPSSTQHTPITHVHKRCDGVILRTTDL